EVFLIRAVVDGAVAVEVVEAAGIAATEEEGAMPLDKVEAAVRRLRRRLRGRIPNNLQKTRRRIASKRRQLPMLMNIATTKFASFAQIQFFTIPLLHVDILHVTSAPLG